MSPGDDPVRTSAESRTGPRLRVPRLPASSRGSLAVLAGILLILLLSTFMLGWFGAENLGSALTYTGRITGAILVAVSLTTLLGSAAAVDHWYRNSFTYSGMVALIAAIAAFVTNVLILLETFKGDSTGYRVLWALLTAGSLWAALALWRTSVVIPAPKRVAAAVIVTSSIAVANFGYQHLYQPYQRGAKPLVKMVVGEPLLSQDGEAFSVPIDIRLENRSDVGFYVIGAEFHAMGERVPLSETDRLRAQWREDAEKWSKANFFPETHPLARWEIHQPGELVAAHPWTFAGNWIEADDEFHTRTVVQLPIDTEYDQLAFYANVSLARKDRLGLENLVPVGNSWSGGKVPRWIQEGQKDIDSIIYRGRVHENNAIADHTMDPRSLTLFWRFGPHGAGLVPMIRQKGEEDLVLTGAEDRALRNRYGLVDAGTGPFERTLWDVKSRR
ncbi:hypothetical protein ACFW2D_13755 [Streptomyces sp. NPDC058914]|uniref:hypothetical protein n=1 Tax=Streptomyces TaxID=1883 RepID=UPI0036779F0A